MSAWLIAVIVVAAVVVVGAIVWLVEARRRANLRSRFGSEYDRALDSAGNRRAAERNLRSRVEERKRLELHPLAPAARNDYETRWRDIQGQFVDAPQTALTQADALLTSLMRDIGYPVDDFEHQAALASVDHAQVVDNYRQGHRAYLSSVNGQGTTETMRRGLISYRSLFAELMDHNTVTSDAGPR